MQIASFSRETAVKINIYNPKQTSVEAVMIFSI